MKPEELRIGNLTNVGKVIEISEERIIVERSEITSLIEGFSPVSISGIPLTEDWLLKFGFEQGDDVEVNKFFWIHRMANRPYRNISVSPESGTTYYHETKLATIIKYVHQLQNLYFALTGEELNIHQTPELL